MCGYSEFAQFYDLLTQNVDYAKMAEKVLALAKEYGAPETPKTLDIACGSGSLSFALADLGCEVFGVDLSEEMLTMASGKGDNVQFLHRDMTELAIDSEFELAICTLDSINHLPDTDAFSRALASARLALVDGGLLIFDVNTPYKHSNILGNNAYTYDYEGLFCSWQNELQAHSPENQPNKVDIFLDFFEQRTDGMYIRHTDFVTEIAPELSQIRQMIAENKLELLAVLDESRSELRTDTERAIFVVRR